MQNTKFIRLLPNLLTILRIICVPFIIYLMLDPSRFNNWAAAIIFIFASITDYLDGYIARKYNVVTLLGKFLDPISDKLLVTSILIMLIPMERVHAILVILLLFRDILIDGLRSVAAAENIIIAAGPLGKWKTAIQMISIPGILVYEPVLGIPFHLIGYWGLWLSVVLSLLSGVGYLKGFFKDRNVL